MDTPKMMKIGIALVCLALVVALIPSVTPKSVWRTTRWFEYTTNKQTGEAVPVRYRQRKGEPSQQELTKMALRYGVVMGSVNEMVPLVDYLDPIGAHEFGLAMRAKYPDLATRLGFVEIVATKAKVVRYLGLMIFLAGCAYLFGALYQTYQAEKDIPDKHLRL